MHLLSLRPLQICGLDALQHTATSHAIRFLWPLSEQLMGCLHSVICTPSIRPSSLGRQVLLGLLCEHGMGPALTAAADCC